MIKPQEWETTEASTGDFKKITLGGHVCQVKKAIIDVTKTGKEVLILEFDIANGECANFYLEDFQRRFLSNPDAKWQGIYRQLTEGNSLKFFKGLITAIEKSNSGYTWNWDEKSLVGKFFGGVFGQEEYLNNKDEIKLSTKCRFIRSVDQVLEGVEVPKIKTLSTSTANSGYDMKSFGSEVFPEEEIPF